MPMIWLVGVTSGGDPKSALVCLPDDMPEPSSWAYQGAVEQAMKLYTAIADEFRTSDRTTSTAGDLEQFAYENAKARLDRGETGCEISPAPGLDWNIS